MSPRMASAGLSASDFRLVAVGHGYARLLRVLYRYCVERPGSRSTSSLDDQSGSAGGCERLRVAGRGPRQKRLLAFSASAGMTSSVIRDGGAGSARDGCSRRRSRVTSARRRSSCAAMSRSSSASSGSSDCRAGCDREDLAQEARVGLLSAIRAWRPERGPFPAFADRCVTNQALLALKAACAHKHQVLSLALVARLPRSTAPRTRRDAGRATTLLDTLAAAPRRTHRPRSAPARARAADERAARAPHAHRERARRAGDGAERTEPHAARLDACRARRMRHRRRPTALAASSPPPSRRPA